MAKLTGKQLNFPAGESWQVIALRELADLLYQLSNSAFETKRELLDRMQLSKETIEVMGESDD